MTSRGRPFQTRAPASGKARWPMVDSCVRLTVRDDDEAERRCRQASSSLPGRIRQQDTTELSRADIGDKDHQLSYEIQFATRSRSQHNNIRTIDED